MNMKLLNEDKIQWVHTNPYDDSQTLKVNSFIKVSVTESIRIEGIDNSRPYKIYINGVKLKEQFSDINQAKHSVIEKIKLIIKDAYTKLNKVEI